MNGELTLTGPIGVRRFRLDALCAEAQGHKHNYDHTTIVLRGRLKVRYRFGENGRTVEGESGEFGPGECVAIKAGVEHTLKALEPDTHYLCVFSHRDFDGLVTQAYQGNQEAYE